MAWRFLTRESHTDRHESSIVASRSAPADVVNTSTTVMRPRSSGKQMIGHSRFLRPSFTCSHLTTGKLFFDAEI
jgi:hypothetical protein